MSFYNYTDAGFIELEHTGSGCDGLLSSLSVVKEEDQPARFIRDCCSLPTYGEVVELLKDELWVEAKADEANGIITVDEEIIASGGLDDEIDLLDIAKIIEHEPDTNVVRAIEMHSWDDDGDAGGAVAYFGKNFVGYDDTTTVCDDFARIDNALANGNHSAAADIIGENLRALISGIRDVDERSTVAFELVEVCRTICTDHMSEADLKEYISGV